MRTVIRTIAYSIALCVLLGYLSYRVHSSPSQIRLRLEDDLGRLLACPPRAEGCEQPFLELLTIEKVTVPACPVIEGSALLQVEGIRVNDSARRAFRRILAREPDVTGEASMSVHAASAGLLCERAAREAAGGVRARWNFDDLLEKEGLERLGTTRFQVNVDRLLVEVRDLEGPARKDPWRFDLREAEVRATGPSGLSLEADLAEGEYWGGGHAQASWHPGEEIVVRGGADELRNPEAWLPLLGGHCRTFWDVLRPAGAISIDLEELRLDRRRAPRWRASARHYDSILRLGRLGAEVRHVSGVMNVTESSVLLGEEGPGPDPTGDLWGMPVEVSGKVGDASVELNLRVASVAIGDLAAPLRDRSARESPLTGLLSGIRPSGTLEGGISFTLRPDGMDAWSAELRFREVVLGGISCLAGAAGTLSLDGGEVGRDGTTSPPGKGVLRLESAACAGLEGARGRIDFNWDSAGLRATLYDLKVGASGTGEEKPETGTVFGTLAWGWDGILGKVDLRWMGITVDTALIRLAGAAGSLERQGPGAEGRGRLQVEGARIPAGVLGAGAEEAVFGPGTCNFRLDEKSLEIRTLELVGDGAVLRAAGTIGLHGDAAVVLFIAQGPAAPAVAELPDESGPHEWKEAAHGSYRAFRVTGSLMKPQVREIGGLDPAFVGGSN